MAGLGISLQDLIDRYQLSRAQLDKELGEEHLREVSRIIDDHETLGPELGLTTSEMTTINSNVNKQDLRKMEMLRKWKQKCAWKATYRKLTEALLRCRRGDHARDVCVLLAQSASPEQPVASAGHAGGLHNVHHDATSTDGTVHAAESEGNKATNSPVSPPSWNRSFNQMSSMFLSEEEVKEKVEDFSKRFNEMAHDTLWALKSKNVTPEEVIYFIKMPDPYYKTRDEHMDFLDTLNTAANILHLFTTLNEYWDHFNYHLLERLIMAPRIEACIDTRKCSQLQKNMSQYVQEMNRFRRQATLGVYCKVFAKQEKEVPEGFRRKVTKHEWSEMNTLQDVEDFRQRVAQEHQLHICLVFFKNILFGSVQIIWWIPIVTPSQLQGRSTMKHHMNIESLEEKSSHKVMLLTDVPREEFEVGDTVMVERESSPWYGVIRWIGEIPNVPKLIAGIEMENEVEGGHSGEINGVQYFTCEEGYGLFLPVSRLQRDDRFDNPPSPVPTPEGDVAEKDKEKSLIFSLAGVKPSPLTDEDRLASPTTTSSPSSGLNALTFQCPGDQTGLIIGRGGKNIQEVQSETNTTIKVQPGNQIDQDTTVVIVGTEDNRKKALSILVRRVSEKIAMHTAATETIIIPNRKLSGRVIGKGGSTRRAIENVSGARIKIEEKKGLDALLDPEGPRECKISGSAEEIEAAKELIKMAQQGRDVAQAAQIAAHTIRLMKELTKKGFSFPEDIF